MIFLHRVHQPRLGFSSHNGRVKAEEGAPSPRTRPSQRLLGSDTTHRRHDEHVRERSISRAVSDRDESYRPTCLILYPSEGDTGPGGARGRRTTEEDERKCESVCRTCCSTTSQATAAGGCAAATMSDVAWQAQAQNAPCGDEFSS